MKRARVHTGSVGRMPLAVSMILCAAFLCRSKAAERTVEVVYSFDIHGIPRTATGIAAWVPVPPTTAHQRLLGFEVDGGVDSRLLRDTLYGNSFARFDFIPPEGKHVTGATARFRVWRTSYDVFAKQNGRPLRRGAVPACYLAADNLVPIDGRIAAEALQVVGSTEGSIGRAKALFDHIVKTMRYDKSGTGWGRGDAAYACDIRRGNCTDFHSLFIAESRSLDIPARFLMGLPLPREQRHGNIPGYHCWAEFYSDEKGWIPLDASEAHKSPDRKEQHWGRLDENRILFSIGRDIKLPGSRTEAVNYSIYPHVEIDGGVHRQVTTRFVFRDVQ